MDGDNIHNDIITPSDFRRSIAHDFYLWSAKDCFANIKSLQQGGFSGESETKYDSILNFKKLVRGRKSKQCFQLKLSRNHKSQLETVKTLKRKYSAYEIQSYIQDKRLFNEVFDLERDPETLDDSDIEMLINDEDDFDCNEFAKEIASQKVDTPIIKNIISEEKTNSEDFEIKTMIVTDNSIYEAGKPFVHVFKKEIHSCKEFQNNFNGNLNDLILISLVSGYLVSVLPSALNESTLTILQYWNLGEPGEWIITKNENNEKEFIVINKNLGSVKFFSFINEVTFQLVNNLDLENTTIIDCIFINNQNLTLEDDEKRTSTLFIPMIRFDRIVYFCVEWGESNPENKTVHQLTLLDTDIPLGCLPLGSNNSLVYTAHNFSLVSVNQIMSGETTFKKFQVKELKGIKQFFSAPILLKKMKLINGNIYEKYQGCTIISTSVGSICLIISNPDNEIKFFLLTRFKGLRSICPLKVSQNNFSDNSLYDLIIISFGRTLRLTIDLSQAIEITETSNYSMSKFSLNGVIFKHTMDSASEDNTNLVCVPSTTFQGCDLWLTSPAAISNVIMELPARKVHTLCKLHQFQIFNFFKCFEYNKLPSLFRNKVFEMAPNDDSNFSRLVMVASDSISFTRAFTLELSDDRSNFTGLDDLLPDSGQPTIEFFITKLCMIQVTKTVVHIEILENIFGDVRKTNEQKTFLPDFEIDGATCFGETLIIWNVKTQDIWYGKNVDRNDSDELFVEVNEKLGVKFDSLSLNSEYSLTVFSNTDKINVNLEYLETVIEKNVVNLNKMNWFTFAFNSQPIPLMNSKCRTYLDQTVVEHLVEAGFKDVTFSEFTSSTIIAYSSDRICLLSNHRNKPKLYYLKLPFAGKINPILHVCANQDSKTISILFADGLHICDLSYYSWNYSNYLLKSTRNVHKQFLYLEKFKRMLVINLDTKDWDCVKLGNGKTLSLDSSILKATNLKILSVVEIPNRANLDGSLVLIVFESMVKIVKFTPGIKSIKIVECCTYNFGTSLNGKVVVSEVGYIYINAKGSSIHNQNDDHFDSFYCLEFSNDGFKVLNKFNFSGGNLITDFDVCRDTIFFTTSKWNKLYALLNFKPDVKNHHLKLRELKISMSSFVTKIMSLSPHVLLVATRCEGRSKQASELLLFSTLDLCGKYLKLTGDTHQNSELIFDEFQQMNENNSMTSTSPNDNLGGTTRSNPEYQKFLFTISPDEDSQTSSLHLDDIGCNQSDLIIEYYLRHKMENKKNVPYLSIHLEQAIKNIAYDITSKELYVLTTDQSIMKFKLDSHLSESIIQSPQIVSKRSMTARSGISDMVWSDVYETI